MIKKIQVIDVSYGISSNYGNFIEINCKIPLKLRKKILEHEFRHKEGKYSWLDFKNDFMAKNSHFFEVFKLSLCNPEMIINYFLIMFSYYSKSWTINQSAIYPFLYFGLIFVIFFKLFGVPLFNSFLCFLYIYIILNLILLGYTHYYVKKMSYS